MMNTKELTDKVRIQRTNSHGTYRVTIEYRGREYTCTSNNSLAWDSLDGDYNNPMTIKQALQQFWNECKIKNELR